MAVITQSDLIYQGCFRLPSGKFGSVAYNQGFGFGAGLGLCFNAAGNGGLGSLFLGGKDSKPTIGEITIPAPVNSANLADLNTATVLQNLVEPTEGAYTAVDVAVQGLNLGAAMVYGGHLYFTVSVYYDGDSSQTLSHFRRPLNLSTTGQVIGGIQLQNPSDTAQKAAFFCGYMAQVPASHLVAVGNPALTGEFGVAIVTRTSYGPSAFSFDPADIGSVSPVPVSALSYYNGAHPTLGVYGATSSMWNGSSNCSAMVLLDGFDSLMFFGRQGTGTYCYGGTPCGDPCGNDQGVHAYPYRYQIWHYDINDLIAAAATPWVTVPDVWTFDLPFPRCDRELAGVAYDPANQRIYLAQGQADSVRLIIHVFDVEGDPVEPETETTLTRSLATVSAGQSNTVAWADIPDPTASDWIGIYRPGLLHHEWLDWFRLDGTKFIPGSPVGASGSFAFPIPGRLRTDTYEFRLFADDTHNLLATSDTFTVRAKRVKAKP